MADHAHRRVVHGRDDALRLGRAIEVEVVVHGGEAPVEAAAKLEVVVELASGADVELDAVEELEGVAELGFQPADLRALVEEGLAAHARDRALGVVGHGERAVAARARGGHHLLERGAPIAGHRGVQMKIAHDGAYRLRQRARLGGLELAGVLAQHGRDEGQAERGIDLLLGLARDDLAALDGRERVLVEGEAAREGALAQLDVVGLRAREVEQRGAELVGRDDAHVDLNAARRDDAGLRVAAPEHTVDEGHGDERLHDGRGVRGGDDDVDVAAGLGEAAQRAAIGRVGDARHLGEAGDDARRER
ncbi:MAG TPA: hypothetical protein VMT47_08190 [Polyangia bacterium]|nr:hypothetical protein [Polyangia bacterium]